MTSLTRSMNIQTESDQSFTPAHWSEWLNHFNKQWASQFTEPPLNEQIIRDDVEQTAREDYLTYNYTQRNRRIKNKRKEYGDRYPIPNHPAVVIKRTKSSRSRTKKTRDMISQSNSVKLRELLMNYFT